MKMGRGREGGGEGEGRRREESGIRGEGGGKEGGICGNKRSTCI